MSMLAPSRGSGATGLLEQPPAQSLTPPDRSDLVARTAPPPTSSLKSRDAMSTISSARSLPAPETVHPPSVAVVSTPARIPTLSRFRRLREFLARVDDCADQTAAQRDAHWRPVLR